ncbi:PST family polysaccharide transporter [Arthrobacter globiformis]|uniref:lipopolysaccharide biosynthesis protein n=1 Tax=Arthrobacter globiformis TaxID=1665 RepID=UPI0027844298|nr:lipopolysaccharide biosynthesis protein [Arthrobacter globiformis]MDQ1059914.1 PST family polysaccharide transporter [Arthrobacter globiformis]
MSLGRTAAQGAMVTLSLQTARFIVQLSGLVILGRLIAPSEFGLVAMVTAIIGIGDILRELGLVPAAIQARVLTQHQRTNLFWLCSGLGVLVALLVCAASPLIANIYRDDRLIEIALILSLTFVFNGVQAQFQAGLAREMRFAALSVTDLCAQSVGLVVAVTAAIQSFGYWSLVAQLVSQSFALLVLRILASRWMPGLPNRKGGMGRQLAFGKNLTLTQSLVYASSNVDSLIVGSGFGASQLGFYNRGFQILMMPLNQILTPLTTVALPVLSRVSDQRRRFNKYLQSAQIVMAYPVVLLFSGMAAAAQPLIRLIFGEQWSPSAVIFQILSVGGIFQAIGYVGYWIFLARGLTNSHFRFSLLSRSVLILSILAGSAFGPLGVAAGYTIGVIINWPLGLMWLGRAAGVRVRLLFLGGLRAVLLGVFCAGAASAINLVVAPTSEFASILIIFISGLIVAGLTVIIIPVYRRDMKTIQSTIKLVARPKDTTSVLKAPESAK